jgi:hypothetical protein
MPRRSAARAATGAACFARLFCAFDAGALAAALFIVMAVQ